MDSGATGPNLVALFDLDPALGWLRFAPAELDWLSLPALPEDTRGAVERIRAASSAPELAAALAGAAGQFGGEGAAVRRALVGAAGVELGARPPAQQERRHLQVGRHRVRHVADDEYTARNGHRYIASDGYTA